MEFENIIGNSEVKTYLSNSINQNNILHSYLFLGTEGIGKLLIAKSFAKKILCQKQKTFLCFLQSSIQPQSITVQASL